MQGEQADAIAAEVERDQTARMNLLQVGVENVEKSLTDNFRDGTRDPKLDYARQVCPP